MELQQHGSPQLCCVGQVTWLTAYYTVLDSYGHPICAYVPQRSLAVIKSHALVTQYANRDSKDGIRWLSYAPLAAA